MTLRLTTRDEGILDTLTQRVRVLSIGQIVRTWWPEQRRGEESAASRLQALADAGFIMRIVEWAHPELSLDAPALIWRPGEEVPNLGQVSYRLRSRWTGAPRATTAFIATRLAGSTFGGNGGRRPRPSEMTHDLHLAAVFLRLLSKQPRTAQSWISEAAQYAKGAGRHERLPDALVRDRNGTTVIEFGGAYSKRKLMEFHEFCVERSLSYELW